MDIIQQAIHEGRVVLSEHESKQILALYGIPTVREILVRSTDELQAAAEKIGYPLVLKGCSPQLSHKTEKGVVKVDLRDEREALAAFRKIKAEMAAVSNDGNQGILFQEMVKGPRELMAGLTRDPQFGPCVMFGLGGIFTEILEDVSFRLAPLEKRDAMEMIREIRGHRILDAIRGMEAVDLDALTEILMTMGRIGVENEAIKEIDINPLIVRGRVPIAVDALVILQ